MEQSEWGYFGSEWWPEYFFSLGMEGWLYSNNCSQSMLINQQTHSLLWLWLAPHNIRLIIDPRKNNLRPCMNILDRKPPNTCPSAQLAPTPLQRVSNISSLIKITDVRQQLTSIQQEVAIIENALKAIMKQQRQLNDSKAKNHPNSELNHNHIRKSAIRTTPLGAKPKPKPEERLDIRCRSNSPIQKQSKRAQVMLRQTSRFQSLTKRKTYWPKSTNISQSLGLEHVDAKACDLEESRHKQQTQKWCLVGSNFKKKNRHADRKSEPLASLQNRRGFLGECMDFISNSIEARFKSVNLQSSLGSETICTPAYNSQAKDQDQRGEQIPSMFLQTIQQFYSSKRAREKGPILDPLRLSTQAKYQGLQFSDTKSKGCVVSSTGRSTMNRTGFKIRQRLRESEEDAGMRLNCLR